MPGANNELLHAQSVLLDSVGIRRADGAELSGRAQAMHEQWGARWLHRRGYPLVIYVHPRELDPDHPRLALPALRRFKCYVNLRSTRPKLRKLLARFDFCTVGQWLKVE